MPGNNETTETLVRPVFLVDKDVYLNYASYIRRILVGLTGTAHASAMVCPGDVDAESILCPSVERYEHPALRLPIFIAQNRRILLERLNRFKPTVLHTFYPGQIRLAAWLSEQLDIPYVITFHQPVSKWMRYESPIRCASRLISSSDVIAEQLLQKWPVFSEKIDRINVGGFVEDTSSCFSREGDIASLITVQPLNHFKTFELLLNAVRHLVLDGFELMLAIIGSGSAESLIRRHIRKLGLAPVVTLVPPMRRVQSLLAGADIYLHLQDTGRFDAVLMEAMGVGLAVAGCPQTASGLLIDGQTAALWDPKDELNIYACLKQLLGQRETARQLALNGQQLLRRNNSVSRMVDKLMESYTLAQQSYKYTKQVEEPAEITV